MSQDLAIKAQSTVEPHRVQVVAPVQSNKLLQAMTTLLRRTWAQVPITTVKLTLQEVPTL